MNRKELLKVAKPILFNTEMVQAILDSRKSVTRRVVKQKYSDSIFELYEGILCETEPETPPIDLGNGRKQFKVRRFVECKAPYKVGNILYVRETWQCFNPYSDKEYVYKATNDCSDVINMKWLPSIHMPKSAARIFLKVTDVRVERLQEIDRLWNNYDREGMRNPKTQNISIAMQERFIDVWNSTIKKQDFNKYGWNANPFVWVIEFERVEVEDE